MGALFVIYLRRERKKMRQMEQSDSSSGIQYAFLN